MASKFPIDLKNFFEVDLNQKLKDHPEVLKDVVGVYQLEVDDGVWNLDITRRKIKKGKHPLPDCTIRMSRESLNGLLENELNIAFAIITGKIKISGDKMLALSLQELFG